MKRKGAHQAHPLAFPVLALYALVTLAPVAWMIITSIKASADTLAWPPRFIPGASAPENTYWFRFTLSHYGHALSDPATLRYFWNSLWTSGISTFLSVAVGALAGYGFSRYRFRGSRDAQFFILSTRMLPPMAVAVPISFMYSRLGLLDTSFGLILLYTCFNLSFSTWMMKAFFDEIPTAYEEAALLDGYTRFQAFRKVVLPHATSGLAATSVFCLLTSWNEYAFALTLTTTEAVTMPVRIHGILGDSARTPWGPLAAASILFLLPIVAFGLWMRRHLVRGMTYGAVKG